MKVVTKLLAEFVAWRWAPTVGLLSASVLFVLIVVGLVPSEIGVPVANTKFSPKPRATNAQGLTPASLNASEEGMHQAEPSAPVAAAIEPSRPADFGRRGFSPVLDRPEPPPAAPAPPPATPIPVAAPVPPPAQTETEAPAPPPTTPSPAGRVAGIFQSVQNALRAPFNTTHAPQPGSSGATEAPPAPAAPGQAEPPQQPVAAPDPNAAGSAAPAQPGAAPNAVQ